MVRAITLQTCQRPPLLAPPLLAWSLRLEGKTDQEKFSELGWGLRTWGQWNFNECLPREIHANEERSVFNWGDERFGDDWPGRIPAQLVAHTLFFFTKPEDLVLDPMAGSGVVSDDLRLLISDLWFL